jgi:hypothetical protein
MDSIPRALILAVAALSTGCGSTDSDTNVGADGGSDSSTDGNLTDSGSDGVQDASADTNAWPHPDGSLDAGEDAGEDAAQDADTDAAQDAAQDTSDPNFTPDGCFRWFGPGTSGALQAALDAHVCVEVQPGTFVLEAPVHAQPGATLRGISTDVSILVASNNWSFGCCDSMIADSLPADPTQNPFKVQRLTLDGAGVATYNVCCRGYTVENSVLKRSRCSAIGAAGTGVAAIGNQMLESAQPTDVPGKGLVSCATGGFGGVAEGAAIYSEGKGNNYGTRIEANVISGSFGPALDINGAWGGTFRKNIVSGNTGWAAVSLYGASQWLIEDNQINHPANEPPQPYHPYCATGPAGGHSAGIFLCQDKDADNLVTNDNIIRNNQSASFYGILSVGADEIQPYWAPRKNSFENNDVFGSHFGCADDFTPGQWFSDDNLWSGNNCAGTANTGPGYF